MTSSLLLNTTVLGLCWRLMTCSVSFAKLVVQGTKIEKKVPLILALLKNAAFIVWSSLSQTIFY